MKKQIKQKLIEFINSVYRAHDDVRIPVTDFILLFNEDCSVSMKSSFYFPKSENDLSNMINDVWEVLLVTYHIHVKIVDFEDDINNTITVKYVCICSEFDYLAVSLRNLFSKYCPQVFYRINGTMPCESEITKEKMNQLSPIPKEVNYAISFYSRNYILCQLRDDPSFPVDDCNGVVVGYWYSKEQKRYEFALIFCPDKIKSNDKGAFVFAYSFITFEELDRAYLAFREFYGKWIMERNLQDPVFKG